jgi:hypothetical protein
LLSLEPIRALSVTVDAETLSEESTILVHSSLSAAHSKLSFGFFGFGTKELIGSSSLKAVHVGV